MMTTMKTTGITKVTGTAGLLMMPKYKDLDVVFLNDGRITTVLEVFQSKTGVGAQYLVEVGTPDGEYPWDQIVVEEREISGLIPEGYEVPDAYEEWEKWHRS